MPYGRCCSRVCDATWARWTRPLQSQQWSYTANCTTSTRAAAAGHHAPLTEGSQVTPKMLGTSADRKLKTKGAETFGVLLFLLEVLGSEYQEDHRRSFFEWHRTVILRLHIVLHTDTTKNTSFNTHLTLHGTLHRHRQHRQHPPSRNGPLPDPQMGPRATLASQKNPKMGLLAQNYYF